MKIYDFNGKKNISGERIREARIKMHLSQKALAVRLKLEGVELERGHFCYICVDLPEVAQQEAAFLGIFFCVEEATAATIPFFTAQKPVCTEKCQIHLSTVLI